MALRPSRTAEFSLGRKFWAVLGAFALVLTGGTVALAEGEDGGETDGGTASQAYTCQSSSLVTQRSKQESGNGNGVYSNTIEIYDLNAGSSGDPVTELVDLSSQVTEETNALGVYSDGSTYSYYFISTNLGSGAKIYRYSYESTGDSASGSLQTWNLSDLGFSLPTSPVPYVYRGGVDLSTGDYYFTVSAGDGRRLQYIYQFDVSAGTLSLRGYIDSGGTDDASGDLAFDLQGNLYMVVGQKNNTRLFKITAADLAAATGGQIAADQVGGTISAASTAGSTWGVGIAYGNDGYLYITTTGGEVLKINPEDGSKVSELALIPNREGDSSETMQNNTVDIASCTPPSTITVQKTINGRVGNDQFALSASKEIGETETSLGSWTTTFTAGTETGSQEFTTDPLLIDPEATYTVGEVGNTSYDTSYACIDKLDSTWTMSGSGTSISLGSLSGSGSRAIVCAFTNTALTVPVTVAKQIVPSSGGTASPASGWEMAVTAADTTQTGYTLAAPDTTGNITGSDGATDPWTVAFTSADDSATLKIAEALQDGYSRQDLVCTQGGSTLTVSASDEITVTPGASVLCTFTNEQTAGSVSVTKKDATSGAALAGATFKLWLDENGDGVVDSGDTLVGEKTTAGTEGSATWSDLAWGTYLIEETVAPQGYDLPTETVKSVTVGATSLTHEVSFSDPRQDGSVSWSKVDGESEELLGGSVWTLAGPDGYSVEVTDNTGQEDYDGLDTDTTAGEFTVVDLAWGSYTLTEKTAPAGYEPITESVGSVTISATSLNPSFGQIDNSLKEASFVISKEVAGSGASSVPDDGVRGRVCRQWRDGC